MSLQEEEKPEREKRWRSEGKREEGEKEVQYLNDLAENLVK